MSFNNKIFGYIDKTKPGTNNEIWLTDSVELMRLSDERVMGYVFDGVRYNIDTFESLIEADKLENKEQVKNLINKS